MANIKSAKKRISTIDRRNAENRLVKSTMSTYIKKFRKMLEEGKIAEAEEFSKTVYAYIDSACSKGMLHKNAASRKVGRLASALYKAKASAPVVEEKKTTKKVEEKVEEKATEVVAEKKTTRKTTTKKVAKEETTKEEKPAKKTTTRKTTTKKAE